MRRHEGSRCHVWLLSVALLAGCEAAGIPQVRIEAPGEGDTLAGDVPVTLSASGIEIAPASEHRPGTAHHHLFVDRDVTPAGEKMPAGTTGLIHLGKGDSTFTILGLPVGEHRVIAVLGDSAHVPLEPMAADTVTFTISSSCPEADSPEGVVCRFYETVLAMAPPGLPSGEQQEALAPYLTSRLEALMNDARGHQEEFQRLHPDEKPPFVDGSMFTSLFEGADRFEVVVAGGALPDAVEVTVRFTYQDDVPWEDTVIVVQEDGRWAIDDIVFAGVGEFNPPGRLSQRLQARE